MGTDLRDGVAAWKRRRFYLELLEDRRLLAGVINQVAYFDTWNGGIIRSFTPIGFPRGLAG